MSYTSGYEHSESFSKIRHGTSGSTKLELYRNSGAQPLWPLTMNTSQPTCLLLIPSLNPSQSFSSLMQTRSGPTTLNPHRIESNSIIIELIN